MNSLLKHYGRHILAVAATFTIVTATVTAYMLSRPAQYTARSAMMVQPPATQKAGDSNYVTFSGAMLPAVADLIHSPSFMESVVAGVPGNPSAESVASSSTVEIVPSSIVLRVSTVGTTERQAQALASNLSKKLAATDIFGGLAKLGPVDQGAPVASQTAPDKTLGLGLALLAGTICAALMAQLMLMYRRPVNRKSLSRIVGSETAIFDLTHDADGQREDMLIEKLGALGGVDVVPANASVKARATALRERLQEPARRSSNSGVLLVTPADAPAMADLENTVALVSAHGDRVSGVAIV